MVKRSLVYSKQAQKDSLNARSSKLKSKIEELLEITAQDPYSPYPPYEKLNISLEDHYSRRINIQHRLVYKVYKKERVIHILSMWTHYE